MIMDPASFVQLGEWPTILDSHTEVQKIVYWPKQDEKMNKKVWIFRRYYTVKRQSWSASKLSVCSNANDCLVVISRNFQKQGLPAHHVLDMFPIPSAEPQ